MDQRPDELVRRLEAARQDTEQHLLRIAESVARIRSTREAHEQGLAKRQALRESAYARALAQLETMPSIEQAKGVLIARGACSPEEAFSMLRRASQRSNVPVRELAAEIVARACDANRRGQSDGGLARHEVSRERRPSRPSSG